MNIQIFGKAKCFDTKKAERYFKERRLGYQKRDILLYPPSPRELEALAAAVGGIENLIDKESRAYRESPIAYTSDKAEMARILTEQPALYRTPIVRDGRRAAVGYQPDEWKEWA